MRCIPDETSDPGAPCKVSTPDTLGGIVAVVGSARVGRSEGEADEFQRCKSGGHECIFEESNRGKRSTRKNEALAAKVQRLEAALKGIGSVSTLIPEILGYLQWELLTSWGTGIGQSGSAFA